MKLVATSLLKIVLVIFVMQYSLSSFAYDEDRPPNSVFNSREGFWEQSGGTPSSSDPIAVLLHGILTTPRYRSLVTIRFSCAMKDLVFPFAPRFKNVKWSFVDQLTRVETKSGESQTDNKGFVRIAFASPEGVSGKELEISIGNTRKKVKLGTGPYYFEIEEEACRNPR